MRSTSLNPPVFARLAARLPRQGLRASPVVAVDVRLPHFQRVVVAARHEPLLLWVPRDSLHILRVALWVGRRYGAAGISSSELPLVGVGVRAASPTPHWLGPRAPGGRRHIRSLRRTASPRSTRSCRGLRRGCRELAFSQEEGERHASCSRTSGVVSRKGSVWVGGSSTQLTHRRWPEASRSGSTRRSSPRYRGPRARTGTPTRRRSGACTCSGEGREFGDVARFLSLTRDEVAQHGGAAPYADRGVKAGGRDVLLARRPGGEARFSERFLCTG